MLDSLETNVNKNNNKVKQNKTKGNSDRVTDVANIKTE